MGPFGCGCKGLGLNNGLQSNGFSYNIIESDTERVSALALILPLTYTVDIW